MPTNTPVPNTPEPTVPAMLTDTPVPNTPEPTVPVMLTDTPVPNTPEPTIPAVLADTPVSNTPEPTDAPAEELSGIPAASGIRVMRVEYANFSNSRGEVSWWEEQMKASGINMVALGAGRVEWAFFKWAGHEANWSGVVEDTGIDFLAEDSARYGQWADINAVIDVFSPNYITSNPDKAAINVLGERSPNLVSTAELVHGAFGQMLLDMVGYIAANYPNVDSISITELFYRIDGYGPDDLALYTAATGQVDWPRQSNGQVDIDDPSIGNWRSAVLGEFLGRATAIAHQYGKQLFMDVGISYGNLSLMTNNKGTNYNVMLQNVDKIVVWDYFGEDGYAPEISRDIAAYLTQFGNDRVILSIGLWGISGTTVTATDFNTAIQSAQAGGMPNLWICPGSMMSSDHWQSLKALWGPG